MDDAPAIAGARADSIVVDDLGEEARPSKPDDISDEAVQEIAEGIDDALVRSTLRDQARLMGKVRLPKRGTTKSPLRGKGAFASRSRAALRMARALRDQRRRWLKGDFTQEELDETRKMLEFFKQMENEHEQPDDPGMHQQPDGEQLRDDSVEQ